MRDVGKRAAGALALVGGALVLRPGTATNRAARRQLAAAGRRMRYLGGKLQGASYRLSGRRPDPTVSDAVLADRIRSSLGTLGKRLDIPRVHVMVEDHTAILHGEVGAEADAAEIERAVAGVSGVAAVESYLQVGLARADARPSAGRRAPSGAYRALLDAAVGAGASPEAAPAVVRGVLATFADRIPQGEAEQVAAHLPADVRPLFSPPRRTQRPARVRRVEDLVARAVASTAELPRERAEPITAAIVQALRRLVPDEAGDVAAVLPPELRALWQGKPSGG